EDLYKLAKDAGTQVELISDQSDEGKLLKQAFGGLAGVLRFIKKDSLENSTV
ncbi:MAG: peptide chain release factor aRF-1, partial [Thermoplasmata archaeon]